MFQQHRPSTAYIDLKALTQNYHGLKNMVGVSQFFCPMIKADAYGHGDIKVAEVLEKEKCQIMGVALVEEGVRLRDAGIKTNLLHVGAFDSAAAAKAIVDYKLTATLNTWEQLSVLEQTLQSPIKVHVKFDTGMHRMGFALKDAEKVFTKLKGHNKIQVEGIMTHLHSGEDADDVNGSSFQQLKDFQNVIEIFKPLNPIAHALNSSGAMNFAKHKNSKLPFGISSVQPARPGLALYGVSPIDNPPVKLEPVMSVRTKTTKYLEVKAGETVSYSATWQAPSDSVVAVVPMGYADGYHRILSNKGEVLFRGQKAAVVGIVCMDYFMINVTPFLKSETVDSLKNEEVTLFGYDSSGNLLEAASVAKKAGTVAWEVLTSVSGRVPRKFLHEGMK